MEPQDTIFLKGRDIADPAERAAYLTQACGDDAALRQRVEAMLRDAVGADAFFGPEPAGAVVTEGSGTVIGRYKLLQKIGEGGMGVVYMAEQREPVIRKVALKVIKLGMDTKNVVARFEAERQALALMDHPNIAKVLDGGATGSGRPYFVMDLVAGLPITQFCDEANLSTRDRLDLFMEVCSAVQHAHQKGIIHRDLKPSNILVTLHGDKPVPKVIDFGVAKATAGRLTEKTLFTQFQQFIGTPAYMSPEQASLSGLDVDTRSDIYGLGVLLYELLTGTTPFDGKELLKAGLDEMRRTIQEKEPLRPSNRISTLQGEDLATTALRRRTDPPKLIHLVRGDLDWIVMKALEKDRARRYETANGLAADIKRHLTNEPIVARPPSRLYEFQKTVKRHKFGFGAAAVLIAVLVVGVLVSTLEAVRARHSEREQIQLRRQAQAEAAESRRVAAFLDNLSMSLQHPESDSAFRESLAMRLRLYGKDHREVEDALSSLAQVLQKGKLAEGDMTAREAAQKCHTALAEFEKLAPDRNHCQECWFFGIAYEALGQLFVECDQTQEAEKTYRDTQVLWRKLVADFNTEDYSFHLAVNYDALGYLLRELGRTTESLESYRAAQAIWLKLVADFNNEDRRIHLGGTDDDIGQLLQEAGRLEDAAEIYREALAVWKKLVADFNKEDYRDHLSGTLFSLAATFQAAGKSAEAKSIYEEVAERGDAAGLNDLAWLRATSGDPNLRDGTNAVVYGEKAVAATNRKNGSYLDTLAAAYAEEGQFAKAISTQKEAIALSQSDKDNTVLKSRLKLYENNSPYRDDGELAERTLALLNAGKFTEAEIMGRECLALREREIPDDWRTFNARSMLGGSLLGQKKYVEAEPLLISGYEGLKQREDKIPAIARSLRLKEAIQRLMQLCEATARPDQTAAWKQKLAEFDETGTTKKADGPQR